MVVLLYRYFRYPSQSISHSLIINIVLKLVNNSTLWLHGELTFNPLVQFIVRVHVCNGERPKERPSMSTLFGRMCMISLIRIDEAKGSYQVKGCGRCLPRRKRSLMYK